MRTRRPPTPDPASTATDGPTLTIHASATTASSPQRVLGAAVDFSGRRADVWPNVQKRYLQIHESGDDHAVVTEGTWVIGPFWERNRYDWSTPGSVKATVVDSNVFRRGSTWELRATARDGGSDVQMVLHRGFRNGPKGMFASAVHHTVGPW